jgi:hypothetical protein
MPLLTATPILAFLDTEETVSFYTNFGFTCNASWKGYIMCERDSISIHLWQCDDPSIPKNTGCYVYVNEIEGLYEECEELNIVHPNGRLEQKPWGLKQFSILDNSGNIIHFGQHPEKV